VITYRLVHPLSRGRASAVTIPAAAPAAKRATALFILLAAASACQSTSTVPDATGREGGDAMPLHAPHVTRMAGPPAEAAGTLAFQSDRDGRTKIYLLDVPTGAVRPVTHGPNHHDEAPAWSPDGRLLAFSTTRFDGRTYDLAVARPDGTDVRRVTADLAWDRDPSWAADGRSLFFARDGEGPTAIYRVWLDVGHVERVSVTPDRAVMPAASPDGRLVAYVVATVDGFQIFVTDLDTGRDRQVTSVPDGATHPAWTHDGRHLLVSRRGADGHRVDMVSIDTGAHETLVADAGSLMEDLSTSPDARWVSLAIRTGRDRVDGWHIGLFDTTNTGILHILTTGPVNDRAPVWKP
jgi:Tol biopolymer transport system component